MVNVPIVLDTNVLEDRTFIYWLRKYRGEKILPAVAYSECAIHAVRKRRGLEKLNGLLRATGIIVEPMEKCHGDWAAYFCDEEDGKWKKRWRDYMIASHATCAPRVIITKDIEDFKPILGDRSMNPYEFMRKYSTG